MSSMFTTKVLFCFVFVLFCFILFCFVLFCFVSFRFVSFRFVSFRSFRFVSFRFVSFRFVLFCFVLFCFVLFCSVLFCFVLFCFVLFCFCCECLIHLVYTQNALHEAGSNTFQWGNIKVFCNIDIDILNLYLDPCFRLYLLHWKKKSYSLTSELQEVPIQHL